LGFPPKTLFEIKKLPIPAEIRDRQPARTKKDSGCVLIDVVRVPQLIEGFVLCVSEPARSVFGWFHSQALGGEGVYCCCALGGFNLEFPIGLFLNHGAQGGVADEKNGFSVFEVAVVDEFGQIKFALFLTHVVFSFGVLIEYLSAFRPQGS
jgi:hypothetical protein